MRRLSIFILLFSIVVIGAQTRDYFIKLKTKVNSKRTLAINVKTNLPDGTKLLVSVDRLYWENNNESRYSGEIYSKDIEDEDGQINIITKIDDKKWKDEYRRKQIHFAKLNLFTGIRKVSPYIDIRILFSPRRNKNNKVLKILGNDGEYMSGKNIRNDLGFNILDVDKRIKISVK